MILDKFLEFSAEQAITASAASTNIVDLGVAGRGHGEPLEMHCLVEQDFAHTGTETLTIQLQHDSNSDFSTAGIVIQSAALSGSGLTDGTEVFKQKVPDGLKRYIRLYYLLGTGAGAFTGGTISSRLILDRQASY